MIDNGLIAYVSDYGGTFDIWVYDPHSAVHTQVTNGLASSLSEPFWSPDSCRIAFIGLNNIIYVLHLSNREISQIDQLEEGQNLTLDWSPDSQRIAYTKNNQIIIYHVITHQVNRINMKAATDVQWFPNGRQLLYQAPDARGISQLFQINVDGSEKEQLTSNQQGPLNNVRLSPNGEYALYTTPGVSISIIHTVDLQTGQVFVVQGGPLAKNYYPAWSPDSTKIAYSATAESEQRYYSLIKTVGSRGENDQTWSVSNCFATSVSWSPDNEKIVYLSGCDEQSYARELWYLDFKFPWPIRLFERATITSVKWSPSICLLPQNIYKNQLYKVKFQYPINWQVVHPERYEGEDGFFQISAISAGSNINDVCQNEAFHPLLPYGTQPHILNTMIQNQEACFIIPSSDQPLEMREQAALIVKYPVPIQIGSMTYNYFILWASHKHIKLIASTIQFKYN